eukprot:TRINITY_DN97_c0_g1_i2.p1 TRINITY_DN97_c0_g1~~TRINITY_DN97_c0_g1_i2.p1  ORF type:complete len:973 (-),score=285.40 TRINITY_DN97_c0_g1_i2:147-3065(-)
MLAKSACRSVLRMGVRSFAQKAEVLSKATSDDVFNPKVVAKETEWYYTNLPNTYFASRDNKTILNQVHALTAAKKMAASSSSPEDVWVDVQTQGKDGSFASALYMAPAETDKQAAIEKRIQDRIATFPKNKGYRMEYQRSSSTIVSNGKKNLALYTFQTTKYVNPTPKPSESSLWQVASEEFLKVCPENLRARYQEVMTEASKKIEPVCKIYEASDMTDDHTQVFFAFKQDSMLPIPYVQQLTRLLDNNKIIASRKFVNTFSNNVTIYSFHLKNADSSALTNLTKEFFLVQNTPSSALTPNFLAGKYTPEQYTYGTAACKFIYYFLRRKTEEFDALTKKLKDDPTSLARLRFIAQKKEEANHDRIYQTMLTHPALFDAIYQDFIANITTPHIGARPVNKSLLHRVKMEAATELDGWIMTQLLTFNAHVLKTNFFKTDKPGTVFRVDPSFMKTLDYDAIPFGIFFVLGAEYQAFHVRFADIARGGIRVVRSMDRQAYNNNIAGQFAENYGLAFTQNLKNKDIPEFGSKGTILLDCGSTNTFLPFQKYCAAMLDVIGNIAPGILDNYGKPEILFFGPDEWTAEYMEYAARYAKTRGYQYWRAFTTGKPPSLGGVPHDAYGMTTRSVQRVWRGAIAKLGLKETEVRKFMTGGPDGDLGSNEILLSQDKTVGVVDGSGVLCDPEGIDRPELMRLAKARKMVENFDVSKLGPKGFRVKITEKNVTLPHGEVVENGLHFRNSFHLHPMAAADLFVPCGGRPNSINLQNVKALIDKNGKCRYKAIVEGANLFITADARMVLENAGAVLYKDATANKGGVTSSSKEVLASMAFPETEFEQHMAVHDPSNVPQFYKDYVQDIIRFVENNADMEFECIWKECARTGIARNIMTNLVSDKINSINLFIQASPLFGNEKVRRNVLAEAVPQTLQAKLGLETVLKNVPENYLRAMFGCHLACKYVYKYGIASNEYSFFEMMSTYL